MPVHAFTPAAEFNAGTVAGSLRCSLTRRVLIAGRALALRTVAVEDLPMSSLVVYTHAGLVRAREANVGAERSGRP